MVGAALSASTCWLALAGCAAVLGFEDTTLRSNVEGGAPEGGPSKDGDSTPDGGVSRLTTTPAALIVRVGKTSEITVDVARGSDVTGPITIRLTDLPAGVTATNASLDPVATSGKVTLTAAPTATLGSKTITVSAEGSSIPPAQVALLVADAPGTLDKTFNSNGLVSDLSKGLGATFYALGQQTDGKIIAGGAGGPVGGPLSGWLLRRYATNGVPDTSFNAATAGAPADGELRALALDASGKIICVGSSSQLLATAAELTVARFLPSGAIDPSFGGGGVVRFAFSEGPMGSVALGVAVQADGSVVVVGARRDAANVEAGVITRYKSNGTRDVAFNGGNTIVIPATRLVGASVEANGAMFAAGSTTSGTLPSYYLARRTAQGAPDPTFGIGGTVAFGNTYRANGFARLPDGSLAVVGDVQQGAAAYTAGLADDKGNSAFVRAYAVAPGASFYGVAAQDEKRIIAAGFTAVPKGEARVERIQTDGNRDSTFGASGTAILEPAGGVNDVALFAAAVQGDGRILVSGNRSNTGAAVYRLWQ